MRAPWMSLGGLIAVLLTLLGTRHTTQGRDTPGNYLYQVRHECRFLNGTQRVRLLERWIYNRQEQFYFDSDVGQSGGLFVGVTEVGQEVADLWNSQPSELDYRRGAVESYCKHNYGVLENFMRQRQVKPTVKVSMVASESTDKPHLLLCNVDGFYPYDITVRWLKNGEEDRGAESWELLQNGDWTGQITVMLETTIQSRDTFICEVEHISLSEPIQKELHHGASESARSKMLTGIVGFVLGGLFFTIGVIFYLRSKKARLPFLGHLPEEAEPMR